MKKRKRVITIAILLVLIGITNTILLLGVLSQEELPFTLWKLAALIFVSTALAMGYNWARWLSVILSGLIGICLIIAMLSILGEKSYLPNRELPMSWFITVSMAYLAISGYLMFSSNINREITRR
ncbi:MAG: hypothetical protein LBK76_03345 [Verrucomicrobiales bacterium]|jgi:hypothetical protein|nr:hypothetical protein [Verrucomicrobiales bacterium]